MLECAASDSVLTSIENKAFCFVAVVSFEQRATAWAEYMASSGITPSSAFIFDYATTALPVERDRELRGRCRRVFADALSPSKVRLLEGVNAFASNSLREKSGDALGQAAGIPLVVDITCMTRVHMLALVAALHAGAAPSEVWFCYAVPESYGFRLEDRSGWRDVLFVPAGSRWAFKREGQSRGFVLAGHDAERLSVALGELEPASGALVYCGNPKRPDFLRKAREANVKVERRLLQLRMPRWSGSPGPSDGWTVESINVDDFKALSTILRTQVREAGRDQSPVIVYPFGPKPDSLAVALLLREWDVWDAWAVYPVPTSFSTAYSEGVGELQVYRWIPRSSAP